MATTSRPLLPAIVSPASPLVLFVAFVWIYTLINLAQTYFFYCSRIVFAWSFDRLIPERICWVHPKLHSPIWAILIITILAEIGGIPVIPIGGVIPLLYMVWMIVASFIYPAVGGGISSTKLLILAGLLVTG